MQRVEEIRNKRIVCNTIIYNENIQTADGEVNFYLFILVSRDQDI